MTSFLETITNLFKSSILIVINYLSFLEFKDLNIWETLWSYSKTLSQVDKLGSLLSVCVIQSKRSYTHWHLTLCCFSDNKYSLQTKISCIRIYTERFLHIIYNMWYRCIITRCIIIYTIRDHVQQDILKYWYYRI